MTVRTPVVVIRRDVQHAIATFAGHRSLDSTLRYIHLSGRELAEKLNQGMNQIHAWRVEMLTQQQFPDGTAL